MWKVYSSYPVHPTAHPLGQWRQAGWQSRQHMGHWHHHNIPVCFFFFFNKEVKKKNWLLLSFLSISSIQLGASRDPGSIYVYLCQLPVTPSWPDTAELELLLVSWDLDVLGCWVEAAAACSRACSADEVAYHIPVCGVSELMCSHYFFLILEVIIMATSQITLNAAIVHPIISIWPCIICHKKGHTNGKIISLVSV